jgi:tRNA 5-methylaminomethyl-2-thiouridine biosynthesis bifunctional protein
MENFDCCIIGSGLAGAAAVYQANLANLSTLLIDNSTIASGASGNALGGLIPYVTSPSFHAHKFYEFGFAKTFELLSSIDKSIIDFWSGPACQFPSNERPKRIFEGKINYSTISKHDLSESKNILGVESKTDFLLYEKAAFLSPFKLCNYLINKYADKIVLESTIDELIEKSDYCLINSNGEQFKVKNIIIAAATNSIDFIKNNTIKLTPVRGQVALIENQSFFKQIKVPLCYNGYFLPQKSTNYSLLGTTYDYKFLDKNPCRERNKKMLDGLSNWIKDIPEVELNLGATRVAFRTVSKDKLPIIGAISDKLFISTAHGSRGLHSCFIGAEYIVSKIVGSKINEEIYLPVLVNRFN